MKKFFLVIVFIFLLINLYCQNFRKIDSLKHKLSNETVDTNRVKLLRKIGTQYLYTFPDTSLIFYKKALDIAKKTNSEFLIAMTFKQIGTANYYLSNYDKALEDFNKSLDILIKLKDDYNTGAVYNDFGNVYHKMGNLDVSLDFYSKSKIVFTNLKKLNEEAVCLNNIGMILIAQGKYSNAAENYLTALKIFENMKDSANICMAQVNLGNVFYYSKNYTKALEYYKNAERIATKTNNNSSLSFCLNNSGSAYEELLKYNEAVNYYQKALKLRIELGNKSEIAFSYATLGSVYNKIEKYSLAKEHLEKAIKINIETGNNYNLSENYNTLAHILINLKQFELAEKHLEKSIEITKVIDYKRELSKSYNLLSTVYENTGNFKEAHECYKKFYSIDTAIFNKTNLKTIQELEAKYENEKKQLEIINNKTLIEKQEAEINSKQNLLIIALSGLFLLIIMVFFILRLNVKRKIANKLLGEKNSELEKLNQFRDDLTGMIVHDLKNPLNTIINHSKLISTTDGNPETKGKSEQIEDAAFKMLNIVGNIIDIQKMEESKISLNISKNSLNKTISNALESVKLPIIQKNLSINNRIRSTIISNFDSDLIERVLINLLSNAIKFSPNNETITIESEIVNELVKIKIIDNGPGIPPDKIDLLFNKFARAEVRKIGFSTSSGLGLAFSKLVVDAHKEKIGVDSEYGKGSCFWFTLKTVSNTSTDNENDESHYDDEDHSDFMIAILPLKQILAQHKFYETGEIINVINNFECNYKEFISWKAQIENAVLFSNREKYEELIK